MLQTNSLLQVAEAIYQVQLPLPFALRIVNCYLLDNGDGSWTLLDTGLNTPDGQAVWGAAFDALGITPRQISQIVLTHTHPDHYGMAGWLQALTDAPVRLSLREDAAAQTFWVDADDRYAATTEQMAHMAVPAEVNQQIVEGIALTRALTYPHPDRRELIQPGATLRMGGRDFRPILAPGHSDGQLIFYDPADRLLICGDHVLMQITPNIGLWAETDPDPLGRFLASLRDLRSLDVRLALPGHKALITDWQDRVDQLIAHHLERLSRTLDLLERPATAYQVAGGLFNFGRLSVHEMRFAVVETLAHLEYLVNTGAIQRTGDAIWCYQR